MQEDLEQRTVSVSIQAAKLSGRRKSRRRFLGQCDSFADGKKSAHEQRFSVVRRTGSLIGGMTG